MSLGDLEGVLLCIHVLFLDITSGWAVVNSAVSSTFLRFFFPYPSVIFIAMSQGLAVVGLVNGSSSAMACCRSLPLCLAAALRFLGIGEISIA